jgi:polygalacturonase
VPVRWEGTNVWTHAPLLYANGKEDITITGRGTINGQGENWWWRAGKTKDGADRNRPAREAWLKLLAAIDAGKQATEADFAVPAQFLRPQLIEIYGCKNVLVENVTITDSPFWMLHPVYSENVVVRGASFVSWGPNGDGIDVDSCRNVRISDCFFSTGDDCIVLKSGKGTEGRRLNRPTEFVTISNCVMYQGHGGVAIGSETSGGVRDVTVDGIVTHGTRYGIRIKSMRSRGGTVENIRVSNCVIENAPEAGIEVTTLYGPSRPEPFSARTPIFRNFAFNGITIVDARQTVSVVGLPEKPVADLRFTDLTATGRFGFRCSYADGLRLRNVDIRPTQGEALSLDHVNLAR